MKIVKSNLPAACVLAVMLFFASCAKDDSNDPNADDRDKYTGVWSCKETPSGQPPVTFTITIAKEGESDTLWVSNFNQLGSNTKTLFLVAGSSITIPSQSVTAVSISGSGFYSNDNLNLTYSADSDQLTAVCSR
jgi:hypothetical protein